MVYVKDLSPAPQPDVDRKIAEQVLRIKIFEKDESVGDTKPPFAYVGPDGLLRFNQDGSERMFVPSSDETDALRVLCTFPYSRFITEVQSNPRSARVPGRTWQSTEPASARRTAATSPLPSSASQTSPG